MEWKYEENRIYSEDENGELMGEVTFNKMDNGEVDITHVYVNPNLRGQGIASKIMEVMADYLTKNNLKAIATCSYANNWLKKNKDNYYNIISKEIENTPISCRIGGKH